MNKPMIPFRLTGPLSDADFLSHYERIRSDSDFYAEKFGESLSDEMAYNKLAKFIGDFFNPGSVMDIGCGKGNLVGALQSVGIKAEGMDWSEYFINSAPVHMKQYLTCKDLLTASPENLYDLVICMETLEHFPPQLVPEAIESISKYCGNYLFITVPSFGPNSHGPYGIQIINDEWMDDAKNDRYFRYIVVDDRGIPHHGHLTLATYRWWTSEFLKKGLNRIYSLEDAFHNLTGGMVDEHHWNIYILSRIKSSTLDFGDIDSSQLGEGWYKQEFFLKEGRKTGVRWTKQKATCYLKTDGSSEGLDILFYSGPIQLLYDNILFVSLYHCENEECLVERRPVTISPDVWYRETINTGTLKPGIIKVTLELTNGWISKNFTTYDDPRELGIAVHRISLVDS